MTAKRSKFAVDVCLNCGASLLGRTTTKAKLAATPKPGEETFPVVYMAPCPECRAACSAGRPGR